MRKVCFPAQGDKNPVIPGLAINLNDALKTGVIPAGVVVDEAQFNHIENPDAIIGRPQDQFEALRCQAYIKAQTVAKTAEKDSGVVVEPATQTSE